RPPDHRAAARARGAGGAGAGPPVPPRPREGLVRPRGHDDRRRLRDGRGGGRRERPGARHLAPRGGPRRARGLALRARRRGHRTEVAVIFLLACDPYASWPAPREAFPWRYTPETGLPDWALV